MTLNEWIVLVSLVGLAIYGGVIALCAYDFHLQYEQSSQKHFMFEALRDSNVRIAIAFITFVVAVGYLVYANDLGLPDVPVMVLWIVIVGGMVALGWGPIADDIRIRRVRGLWPFRPKDE